MDENLEVEVTGGEEETPSSVEENTPSENEPQEGEPQEEEEPSGENPETELYELPDGRKVDAKTVFNEYKNIQKDYTQKSQKLAAYEKGNNINNNNNNDDVLDYTNPDWVPKTYGDIIKIAKDEIYKDFENQKKADEEMENQLIQQVDTQLEEVKKIDPKVNQNKLFEHATKYNIPNLVAAYKNMKAMNDMVESAKQDTAKNLTKRASNPVSGNNGQETLIDESQIYDPSVSHRSALDYLRQIKKK